MKLLNENDIKVQTQIAALIHTIKDVVLTHSNFSVKDDKVTIHLPVGKDDTLLFCDTVIPVGETAEMTYEEQTYTVQAEPRLYHHRILRKMIELLEKEEIDLATTTISTTTVWQLFNHTIEKPLVMVYGEFKERDLVDKETGLKVALISKFVDAESRLTPDEFLGLGVMSDCPIELIKGFDFDEKAKADKRNREQSILLKTKKKD